MTAAEPVRVRCPDCHRDHRYTSPHYPCPCGAPVAVPLLSTAEPAVLHRRVWDEEWVTVRCEECGEENDWPRPEVGCPCGTLLRPGVRTADTPPEDLDRPGPAATGPQPAGDAGPDPAERVPAPRSGNADARPAFRPVPIRTARDAVDTAARYLVWLGFDDVVPQVVHQPEPRSGFPAGPRLPAGTDLRGRGVVAQVEPSTLRTTLRDVECLWLNGLTAAATPVHFALAGYTDEALARADGLGIPLFVVDLAGEPQPVNGAARRLAAAGPP
ncbi:SIR2 family protein [Streptomyces tsukubensis]|uniref:Restriction endonuclease type IV Mrr domain-containing protein n=1 Tax=Streptomyces tsukubensis (strain DSM 42081 / NBRC 108919 / NRRL 18488 / 9993) TaxID=1114943 RepID=A0A7G3UBI8_STRT9|nr:hypothetical protein [Streptomyces tsukubensis]AZK97325.1 hypothetical protein B7R87_28165 [Streptomyces tsukubensis]QKM66715.1 hypothetical protein STSU_005605 [Streptomyces tsukubensis NRRL18488]TAI44938.1 hypothetical protein EWI31_06625 [Streptomyces tsukubensis]